MNQKAGKKIISYQKVVDIAIMNPIKTFTHFNSSQELRLEN